MDAELQLLHAFGVVQHHTLRRADLERPRSRLVGELLVVFRAGRRDAEAQTQQHDKGVGWFHDLWLAGILVFQEGNHCLSQGFAQDGMARIGKVPLVGERRGLLGVEGA